MSDNEQVEQNEQGVDESANESDKGDPAGAEKVRDPEAVAAKNAELLEELKTSKSRLAEFETAEEERRQAALSEQEKALEEATAAGKAQAMDDLGAKLLREKVLNRAAGAFIDPTDALIIIGNATLDVDDDETIDSALKVLAQKKPHLLRRRTKGGIDQGPQGDYASGATADDWLRSVLGG